MAIAQPNPAPISIEGMIKAMLARNGGNRDKTYHEFLREALTRQEVETALRNYFSLQELTQILVGRNYGEVRREINHTGQATIRNEYREPIARFGGVDYTIPYTTMAIMEATFEALAHAMASLVGDMKAARLSHMFAKRLQERLKPGEKVGDRWTPDEVRSIHREVYGWI